MSERIAVVVGAGTGLGRATALRLAQSGTVVIAVDRNEARLRELPDNIQSEVADATDPSVPQPLLARIASEIGSPDILVNTIGAYGIGDALAATPEALTQMISVNLGPAFWLTQAVAPYMKERGAGAIVHVAARPGLEPMPGFAAYSASKAALVQLIRVMDLELRPQGIRVNAVAPQFIATEANKARLPADLLEQAVSPEAIAEVIAFLVSAAAAPISGAIVPTYRPLRRSRMSSPADEANDWNRKIIEEFRANHGKVGGNFAGAPLLLLHTVGASSGRERVNPLMYKDLGDGRVAVFATRGGAPSNPDWYRNLVANSSVTAEIGTATRQFRARTASGDERESIWAEQKRDYSGFASYEAMTDRVIPVVVLEPA